ncbi:hypothetical protein E2C01_012318 [Portunus trituberculatus]|uniref:Uncharacterized protein n=1 Tax=Portunus trituberculatus TaxID=210409 RepID=A0A5B7DDS2_PORTR|nr:hypothetical protein [Portunus trituberculatus]
MVTLGCGCGWLVLLWLLAVVSSNPPKPLTLSKRRKERYVNKPNISTSLTSGSVVVSVGRL